MFAHKLYNLPCFKKQYDALLTLSVCRVIPNLIWNIDESELLAEIDWNNILSIASALLRISQTAICDSSTNEVQKNAAGCILLSMTNSPAVKLAVERGFISKDFIDSIPFTQKMNNLKIDFEHTVLIKDELVKLNRFQKQVYIAYNANSSVSVSAPTSAGKSYVLCNLLLEELEKDNSRIVYLVPTRALISQVESDIKKLITEHKLQNVNISTVPQNELNENESCVLIFTQERLHWFMIENYDYKIDVIIVDEAQKINDGHRGILLQQKLEELICCNEDIRVFFSSPFTMNPEILLKMVNRYYSDSQSINTQFVAVNQNLLYVSKVKRKPQDWSVSLALPDCKIDLGVVKVKDRSTSELKRMILVSESISQRDGGTIIYSNGAAEAESLSLLLFGSIEPIDITKSLAELIDLVGKTIHKEYDLCKVLEKGIAFHYGNMPLLIREEIERLFKIGEIKYLICTSTLLEGVNLPAKSIIIRKPSRGRGNPLTETDFWNLAGRAGRWGKEFSGNIICIDPNDWKIKPNPIKHKQVIKKAIDGIEEISSDFLEYIGCNDRTKKNMTFEYAFGYYYCRYLSDKLNVDNIFQKNLYVKFLKISELISLPDDIIYRNPSISPLLQQKLLDYFDENIDDIANKIPVYPEDDGSYDDYIGFIGRIGKTISSYPYQLNPTRAILVLNWMTGKPLAYIIKKSQEYWQEKKPDKQLNCIIREVMDQIESFVRFEFAKDSSCYVDILRYFLKKENREDLIELIPEVTLWLEFGVSQKTHLSFLSLGLSRSSTIEITEKFITNTTMTPNEAKQWLINFDFDSSNLSGIIIRDIKKTLNGISL